MLASSATLVALVTTHGPAGPVSAHDTKVTTDEVLQTNFNHLLETAPKRHLAWILHDSPGHDKVMNNEKYLVFASYDRGGACVSALYAVDPGTQKLHLMQSNDGYHDQIKLPRGVLDVPESTTLSEVRSRLYPTGKVVYPTDASESFCPGP